MKKSEKTSKKYYGSDVVNISMNDYMSLKDKFEKLEAKKVGA